jgi:hypothetical protein
LSKDDTKKAVLINGREYEFEPWMEGMPEEEINYMLKARYITAFFRWYPDL